MQFALKPSKMDRFPWVFVFHIRIEFGNENSRYRTRFQASSCNSDSANWPGYEPGSCIPVVFLGYFSLGV